MIKKYNFFLVLACFFVLFFSVAFYFWSLSVGGIGTAPLVFSGDDGLMYHNVAIGVEESKNDFFWVNVIKVIYFLTFPDPIIIRLFIVFICFLTLLFILIFNKKACRGYESSGNVIFYSRILAWSIFLLLLFSPSVYLFQLFSIYRDSVIAFFFFCSVITMIRRNYFLFLFPSAVVFLFRPYMLASLLLSFFIIHIAGVKSFWRIFISSISIFLLFILFLPLIKNLTGFDLVLFRNIFVDFGANSTFGLNYTGSYAYNMLIYCFSFLLNFTSGIPAVLNVTYIFFFFVQTLPSVVLFFLVFSNKGACLVFERKMLVCFMIWVMTFSLMNDNAGNSLRMFSAGIPLLVYVSLRILSISYCSTHKKLN